MDRSRHPREEPSALPPWHGLGCHFRAFLGRAERLAARLWPPGAPGRPGVLTSRLTYSFWGDWTAAALATFRKGMAHALAERGLTPVPGDAVADVVLCGPRSPRLAVWSPRKPVEFAVGVLVGEGTGRDAAGRLSFVAKHRGWDALVWLSRDGESPSACVVDDLGFAAAVPADLDPAVFFTAVASELIDYLPAVRRARKAGSEAHR